MCALRRRPWAPLNSAKASAAPRVTTCWTSGREAERGTRVRAGARPGPIVLARRLLVKWQTKLRVRIQLSDARRKHVPCSATHLFDTVFFDKRFIRANFCQFMLPTPALPLTKSGKWARSIGVSPVRCEFLFTNRSTGKSSTIDTGPGARCRTAYSATAAGEGSARRTSPTARTKPASLWRPSS